MSSLELTLLYLCAAVVSVVGCRLLHLPAMLGYLLAGLLIGPNALALAKDSSAVAHLAEFGVVFLMFVIGLEFNLPKLNQMRHVVFGLGLGQVVLTLLGTLLLNLGIAWGMAQLTFMADAQRVAQLPRDLAAWLAFAAAHPGRTSYPRPPDFHGMTFLKQMLLDLAPLPDRRALYQAVTPEAFARLTVPLWKTLDTLHPRLWRAGKQFPTSAAALRQMMSDGELLLALTFNPNEAANEIAAKRLVPSTVSFQFSGGTIGNTHFVAIPVNARAPAGAQVFANFLLSPAAQARKADIEIWGDPTVLDVGRLPTATVRGAVLSLATDRVDSGRFAGSPTSCSDRTEIFLTMLANIRKTFL